MSKKSLWNLAIGATVALVLAVGGIVSAAVTFHNGPDFTQIGTGEPYTFNLTAEASGQGNAPMGGTIVIAAQVNYTCVNRGGAQVPGQNPADITSQGSGQFGPGDHNGRAVLDLTVVLAVPAEVPASAIGCPNGNWKGINPVISGDVTATATITFKGATLFTESITAE